MKYFELQINRRINKEWAIVLPPMEDKAVQITTNLTRQKMLVLNSPINMGLMNRQSDQALRNEIPFQADLLYWLDDITLGASKPEGGTYVIVSSRLKSIIEEFKLPPHEFYPTDIYCSEIQTSSIDYYLLFIYGNIQDATNFEKSEYTYIDWNTDEILKKVSGAFKNVEEYGKTSVDFFRNKDIKINISKRFFTVDYDVMWGYANCLRINENLKNVIEKENLLGIKFKLHKGFEIVPFSEW